VEVRIALVDDHTVFREAFAAAIERQEGLSVVGQAEDARRAYALCDRARPHLVVLDIKLPGSSGIVAARELARREPAPRVLMLSGLEEPEYAAQAMEAGAHGYALKSQPLEDILQAIRAVARGETYVAPQLVGLDLTSAGRRAVGAFDGLSQREREVFELLVRGRSNPQVASELCISPKTVETHRAHIMRKLGLHSIVELVRFAARHQLLPD
jgi:two-component system response regulator NreC